MKRARSAILISLLSITGLSHSVAQLPFDDPQVLLERTLSSLDRGDIEQAESSLKSIRLLLEADPQWDPDGSYSRRLLPDVEGRLARLRKALEAAEALRRSFMEDAGPGDTNGFSGLSGALESTESLGDQMRDDISRIAGDLAEGRERGALLQSGLFAETRGAADKRVLAQLGAELSEKVENLSERDEQIKIMKQRLESLRREVMNLRREGQQVHEDLSDIRLARDAFLRGLVSLVTGEPVPSREPAPPSLAQVEEALAVRVRERLLEVKALRTQTLLKKTLLLQEVERFRIVNSTLVDAGGRGQTGRIDLLDAAIRGVPVRATGPKDEPTGRGNALLSAADP